MFITDCAILCLYMTNKNNDKTLHSIGDQLKQARESAKLTQSDVAEATGINVNYYAQIERGEINTSIKKLHVIMKALNLKSLDMS